jgi:nicotinamide-nucleotide amidase
MKQHLIFIGNKFIYNTSLRKYILRQLEQKIAFIDSVMYFKESDNSLFLYLENELNSEDKIIIITTKKHFSTVGKLICTVTSDNQVLQDSMLIPQKSSIYEERSYLLEYKNSIINVLQMDEEQKMPEILFQNQTSSATMHVFDEPKETLIAILNPIAQTYEVNIAVTKEIEGWLRVDISSNKYGDISKFIDSSKQLLPKNLIAASNILAYIIEKLAQANKKITFAESCTGGLLSYYFTKNNGASKVLDGSLITYSNSLKENWLAVEHAVIEKEGAVSSEVVEQMSDGALSVSDADYALSVSGIAGDTGGTELKPVGTVYIGVRSKTQHKEVHLQLFGDRNYVQEQSVLHAVKMLLLIDKEVFF